MAKFVLALLMCLGVIAALAAQTPSVASTSPSDACVAALREHSSQLDGELRARHFSATAPILDAVLSACTGDDPLTTAVRAARAEVAVRLGDYQHALDLENSIQQSPPTGRFEWLLLATHQHLGHSAEVNRLAQSLVAESGAALIRGGMTQVESFEAGGYHITAYQGVFHNGPFIRYFEFLMLPTAGGPPLSIAVTRDAVDVSAALGNANGEQTYFVDLYNCSMQAALEQFFSRTPVTYQRARASVDRFLARAAGPLPGGISNDNAVCDYSIDITPGLDRDGE